MLVSVIIPVIRPDKANRCVEAVKKNAGIPYVADDNAKDAPYAFELVYEQDHKRIGCPKMVKRLAEKSQGEMICFLGDDTIPQPDFLKNAIRAMEFMPADPKDGIRWGLVSFNDNVNTSRSAAHWLAHKRLLTTVLDGEFFHTGYEHCYCDDELMIRCQQAGRYIYAFDAIIYHDHPLVQKDAKMDPNYADVYGDKQKRDHALFLKRLNNKWKTPPDKGSPEIGKPLKVAIGLPSGDLLHADFAMCLVNLCLKSFMAGIHVAIINQKSSIVEIGRCEIVAQAKNLHADKLLFLDSDMTFPADLLIRLLAHKKDVVGCDAVQRREPFNTVIRGMDGERLDHAKADPWTPLIEIKGASSACQLIDIKVFDRIPDPPFMVTWSGKNFLGEDYYFANLVRKAGYKIYCDMPLSRSIGHIGIKAHFIKAVPKP